MKDSDNLLKVLVKWKDNCSNGFDGFWFGYSALSDETGISINVLKERMKELKKQGMVKLKPTYDNDYRLNGSGWFLCQSQKGISNVDM